MEINIVKTFITVFIYLIFIINLSKAANDFSEKIIPKSYKLSIKTKKEHFEDLPKNQGKLYFKGNVEIKAQITSNKPFQTFLNADSQMKVVAKLETADKKTWNGNLVGEKIVFNISEKVNTEAKITVDYEAPFGEDMTGLYRSSYKDSENKNRWLLSTHFEPIFARKAFPCFDQPNLKATFQVSIEIPPNMTNYFVLSNTPCKLKENTTTYECKVTKKMSSYLLAFTISDLKSTEEFFFESNENIDEYPKIRKIKTFGQKEMIDYGGKITLVVAKEALEKLTEYLKKGYAFEKMDQVGIPDFSAGAMENWGLILYREKALFINEKGGSILTKQSSILTIIHELVHQWFGNLVTLESWDYIWLNEAFATYLEYVIAEKIENPKISTWNYLNQMLVNEIHLRALETDGYNSSKELSSHIADEKLIFSYFNDIPYSKGAAVLRMWDLSLPSGKFQESLQNYIKNRSYESTNPSDLFYAFNNVAKMDKQFFNAWTNQPGYPVINVKKVNNVYRLTQNRFFWDRQSQKDKTIYAVPITYTYNDQLKWNTTYRFLFQNASMEIPFEGKKWIIVNNKQAGYYRVNYDENNWRALSEALCQKNFSGIPELNRAQIINDIFSLARSNQDNYVHYSMAMQLSKYLKFENSFIVWKTALNAFDFLQTKLYKDEKIYSVFKNHVLELLKPHFTTLNVTKVSHTEALKAIEISRWACALNLDSCVQEALKLYSKNSLPPDTKEIILCTAIKYDKNAANEVLKKYEKEVDSAIKIMYLSALGCSSDENFINRLLNKTLTSTSEIRKQDFIYVLSSVYNGNSSNVNIAFNFIRKNFKKIAQEYGGLNPLGRAVTGIARKLISQDEVKALKELVEVIKKTEETKEARESAETALKIAESNLDWMVNKKNQFASYFNSESFFII